MPDLMDKIYCAEQIHIPPTFPYIMKLYCKAAIRTQPYDLLKWSAAYFRALANGEDPPAKERVEFPPYDSPGGITPGYIKLLIHQFGKDPETVISAQTLFKKWTDISLEHQLLIRIIALLGATTQINWVKFVALCAGFLSKTLTHTMILICDLFTEEPEGGMATVPYGLFVDLYMYLAQKDCGPISEKEIEEQEAVEKAKEICEAVEKIREGLYGESEEELGEMEEISEKKEEKDEKSEEVSVKEEEIAEEEREDIQGEEEIHKSRSKKKKFTKESSSPGSLEEQLAEEEELERDSVGTVSIKSSVRITQSTLSNLTDDEEDDSERSKIKKNAETEGEKTTDNSKSGDNESYNETKRATFRDSSEQKDTLGVEPKEAVEPTTGREGRSIEATGRKSTGEPKKSVAEDSKPLSVEEKSVSEKPGKSSYPTKDITTSKSERVSGHQRSSFERESDQARQTISTFGKQGSKSGKLNLDQFEDSIRAKIEEKLAEEDAIMDEEEKQLKDLTSYLTTTTPKTEKFAPDNLGFKIFTKYLRQDVPGIGPFIETAQVEKVVDYMDYWANKQNGMVMPRNIRHWMCPPLDKIPGPEP